MVKVCKSKKQLVYTILCFVHLYLPGIYAFVILKDVVATFESIAEDLKNVVRKKIAAVALPNSFWCVNCYSHSILSLSLQT